MFAFFTLYFLIRPRQPESVTLGFTFFREPSERLRLPMFYNPWYAMRRYNGHSVSRNVPAPQTN